MNGTWRILCYHEVAAAQLPAFRAQLHALLHRGWRSCSLDEGLAADGALRGARFSVTFDDGDHSVRVAAKLAADEFGIPCGIYVTTDYVERGLRYRDAAPRATLAWDDLRRLAQEGHTIGGHSHTHADMPRCGDKELLAELERASALIRARLGLSTEHISYPWGQHDARTTRLVRTWGGLRSAATIDRGVNRPMDPWRLNRDLVNPGWSVGRLTLALALGRLPWLYRRQRSLRALAARLGNARGAAWGPAGDRT